MGQTVRTQVLMTIIFFHIFFSLNIFCQPLVIEKPQEREPLHMALIYEETSMQPVVQQIKKLLTSTGLFEITLSAGSVPATKQEITAYMRKGFSVVLFLQPSTHHHIAWRLYDATDASMLIGKNTGTSLAAAHPDTSSGSALKAAHPELVEGLSGGLTARLISDCVYSHLFNHESYFLTKIAYIKKSPTLRNKKRTELCVLDPVDGTQEVIVKDNRILVAPQWSRFAAATQDTLWLSVSEFTPSNVRLLGVDLHGHSWPIIDLGGTCVGTAQQDGNTFVYVRSGVLWLYEFDKKIKKSRHTKLTDSRNTSGCPSLLRSGDIIYSCNNRIYRHNRTEKKSHQLPVTGACLAPDVHQATDRIIFSRSVKGVLQLHSCDAHGHNITQITFGPGNKIDACWSACGNYIVYTRCEGKREQIALYNCMNQTERILTPEHQQCGYPSWSSASLQLYS
jgi:hypothetical protein